MFSIPFLMYAVEHFSEGRACVPKTQQFLDSHIRVFGIDSRDLDEVMREERVVRVITLDNLLDPLVLITEQEDFLPGLEDCKSSELIVVRLAATSGRYGQAHANGVVINTVQQTVLRVEPNGYVDLALLNDPTYTEIQRLLEIGMDYICNLFAGYRCLRWGESCPKYLGPQQKQKGSTHADGGGYCAAWADYMLLTQILNPDIAYERLAAAVYHRNSEQSLKRLIRRFMDFVDKTIEHHRPDVWEEYLKSVKEHFPKVVSPQAQ
jgi:hypothetical protein